MNNKGVLVSTDPDSAFHIALQVFAGWEKAEGDTLPPWPHESGLEPPRAAGPVAYLRLVRKGPEGEDVVEMWAVAQSGPILGSQALVAIQYPDSAQAAIEALLQALPVSTSS
jgi:hypothetical protein